MVLHHLEFPATAGDEKLVEQIRRGNEAAFEVAFERHGARILGFCRHMLGSREEAEDADKEPLNAELLTMLLLTLCFGLSVGWLLRNAQRQGALCSLAVVHPSFATTCEDLPSLGVFRL